MRMVRRMLAAFLSVFLLIGVSVSSCAGADGALKIGDGDVFLLKSLEIVDAYNDLMSGRDPNYPDADELLKIRVDRYGQSYFSPFISVKKSTNQFAVFFNLADELIQDENDDTVPDLILIFTKGRKEWVEKDESVQMLPDLLAAVPSSSPLHLRGFPASLHQVRNSIWKGPRGKVYRSHLQQATGHMIFPERSQHADAKSFQRKT